MRDVNFRINLTQGEQVTGRFYCICFPRINIILIHFLKHSGQKKGLWSLTNVFWRGRLIIFRHIFPCNLQSLTTDDPRNLCAVLPWYSSIDVIFCLFSEISFSRCRNIFAIQQNLTNITMSREGDLDRARQYYELLYSNPDVSASLPLYSAPTLMKFGERWTPCIC